MVDTEDHNHGVESQEKAESEGIFSPIEHESLVDLAVKKIEELILAGVLREGSRIPSERDLADQLKISRPKVREALQQLSDQDLISVVPGSGMYISKLGASAMSPALIELYKRHPSAIFDNLEYRRDQEAFAARLAAERRTETDCMEITRLVEEMRQADQENDTELCSELDMQFHLAIAYASHNRTLIHMISSLYSMNRSLIFYNRSRMIDVGKESEILLKQHSDLAKAICEGNPEKAEAIAKAHIDFVFQLVERGLEYSGREELASIRARYLKKET